jgi:hypothetical protein
MCLAVRYNTICRTHPKTCDPYVPSLLCTKSQMTWKLKCVWFLKLFCAFSLYKCDDLQLGVVKDVSFSIRFSKNYNLLMAQASCIFILSFFKLTTWGLLVIQVPSWVDYHNLSKILLTESKEFIKTKFSSYLSRAPLSSKAGLWTTLLPYGFHNFWHSTTPFWRADNGTLQCCFRNFRRSSALWQAQIRRRILDAWKFRNNDHRFEWTQPELVPRKHYKGCCKGWGCWRWWERKDYWWLKQHKWTRNDNPCCWSCSKIFARFPNHANEGEEVIPSLGWLAIEQVHKLGSDSIKMGHSFSGKGMSTTK